MKNYKIESLEQIKQDPEIRIVFYKADYPDYIALIEIAKRLKTNITSLARACVKIRLQGLANSQDVGFHPAVEEWETRTIRMLHGIEQMDLFEKDPFPKIKSRKKDKRKKKIIRKSKPKAAARPKPRARTKAKAKAKKKAAAKATNPPVVRDTITSGAAGM